MGGNRGRVGVIEAARGGIEAGWGVIGQATAIHASIL